ncbi:MAG: acetyl-CoA carboxylase carboxyltransferase subunit alpha [Chloroflexi bacterium]|jgi:acetyl-CoA carboxylase carboxyl transferase alpha subunit|nr:acetyl-CoA carboxylase carboxyltransferase subunit alpha [Chloroflexota bacterium]
MVDRLLGRQRPAERPAAGSPAPVPDDARAAVWASVQLARNPRRPHALELIAEMASEFTELHGDRLFGDDGAIVGGLARIDRFRVVVVGHQKGADTDENIRRTFGMAKPEGFRKAIRLFELAERFGLPVVTLVDTPGAYPGAEAEERGVAEAIARSIGVMTRLRVPIVSVITGEGGSGGALAIAVGDVVVALEHAVYSVISPEGCASILWRTPERAADAALAMRMSARDQQALGVVDVVVAEPGDGAHSDPAETARRLRAVIVEYLASLATIPADELVALRARRYRSLAAYEDLGPGPEPVATERPGLADRLRRAFEAGSRTLGDTIAGRPPAGGERRDDDDAHEEEDR